jgi:dolichol-phosphate mannosyltransferase
MKVTIVLPTYNERENIVRLLGALRREFEKIEKISNFRMSVLVVDDNSPDGTGVIVEKIQQKHKEVHLITGQKRGLGRAYIRGFRYAIDQLHADVVMEMDADFSHDPKDVVRLILPLEKGHDFIIGSRYINGGSIPSEWSFMRKMNSRYGNIFARYVAGISQVHDCTAGFRAIRTQLLKKSCFVQLDTDGYCFQMNLLHLVISNGARVLEVPVHFKDRKFGKSKIRMKDITEFIINAFKLRFKDYSFSNRMNAHLSSPALNSYIKHSVRSASRSQKYSQNR